MGERTISRGPSQQSYRGIGDAAVGAISVGREAAPTSMHRISKFRLVVMAMMAVLPSFLLRPLYRLFLGIASVSAYASASVSLMPDNAPSKMMFKLAISTS